ncbi:phosphopantothenoylcysteine decarboxylase/phosphopantothenate--cysteine ligase [Methanococcus voltae]|uniref:Coenzyme A biosynthesis bifunctional protein CoaBC n=3 Tax=Methanococcus voltae TaxID=2188 RepID=A0A8J7URN6_METVO|nr:phosphopantothenoylcysteine decarboxylase/phosphopantothenate--cysteine ligase [Methanococcus voltae]MCS3921541.1 phosphopantothenoylcysteine decarboxylase/phosphopantothenate--cysteine ligase [Methanococcus voltae PS]
MYSNLMHPTKSIKYEKSRLLDGKTILVAVTSSIAAIEAPRLMRELMRHGADVECIYTPETEKIVGKAALMFGCGNQIYSEITGNIEHVGLYHHCDAMVVYPATANAISKINLRMADNIVTTTATVFFNKKPLILVPAMHENMVDTIWKHVKQLSAEEKVYVTNSKMEEEKAKVLSIYEVSKYIIDIFNNKENSEIISENSDELETLDNLDENKIELNSNIALKVKNKVTPKKDILILGGSTVEFIDKVRVISNLSSGKTAKSLAEAFCKAGHNVKVIMGNGIDMPYYVDTIKVTSAKNMLEKALEHGKHSDIIISCAAISDYTPYEEIEGKINSDMEEKTIKLVKTPKVIHELKKNYPDKIIIGYKAEYNLKKSELMEKALDRLYKYGIDVIIANDLSKHYFGDDYNDVLVIDTYNTNGVNLKGSKDEIASKIVKYISKFL